jgi:4'-phosphopantetheinyl transferase
LKRKYNKYGKPYIKNEKIQFNISHSGDFLILAISNKYDLGIDLEQYDCNVTLNELGQIVFSLSEQLFINNDINNFYKLWTKKESLIKLYGDGFFSNNLQNTQLNLDNTQQLDNLVIYHSNLFNNYSFAICIMNIN